MDEEEASLYSRHSGIKMRVPESIFVIGCGGTGTWTAFMSAMIGVRQINLSDSDILEEHNRNRLPYEDKDVGKNKAVVLKEFIHKVRPNCEILTYEGIYNDTGLFQLSLVDIVFDCTDDSRIQEMVYKYCKEHKLKYVRVGCNAGHVTVLGDLEGVWGEGEQRYQVTPISIISPVLASLSALYHVVNEKHTIDYLRDISDIFKSTMPPVGKVCDVCPNKESCSPCVEHQTQQFEFCTHCPVVFEGA